MLEPLTLRLAEYLTEVCRMYPREAEAEAEAD